MSDGMWEAQVAIYGVLKAADPEIAGGRIFAPAKAGYSTFPYVDIGESDAVPTDTSGSEAAVKEGQDLRVLIHVWDRGNSQQGVKETMSQVRAALHDKNLSIEGQTSAFSLIRSARVDRDPDGETWHGVIECRVLYHA